MRAAKAKENGNSIAQAREVIEKEAKERGEIGSAEINAVIANRDLQMFPAVLLPSCTKCGHREIVSYQVVQMLPIQLAIEAKPKLSG